MKIPKFLDDLSVISKLGDNPGADNGLTAEGLKAKFDEAGLKLQTFLNETLIEKINSLFSLDAPPHEGMNMTGPINMNKNKLGGLADPAEDGDAVPLGFANKNFAPAGYGLGEYAPFITDANEAILPGFYRFDSSKTCANIPSEWQFPYGTMIVSRGSAYIEQLFLAREINAKRTCTNGTWGEWEYINPPMVVGVEYRTTERYHTKPVYAKLVDFGALPNNTMKEVQYASYNEVERPISWYGEYANQQSALSNPSFSVIVTQSKIVITTTSDKSSFTAKIVVKYTKITD